MVYKKAKNILSSLFLLKCCEVFLKKLKTRDNLKMKNYFMLDLSLIFYRKVFVCYARYRPRKIKCKYLLTLFTSV